MSTIPVSVTEEQFNAYILPFLNTAKRGFVSKIPLYKMFNYMLYRLHTGCQWDELPIERDPDHPTAGEISWWAVYYHFRKWSRDGSLEQVWQHSVQRVKEKLDLSVLNLDGSHAVAKTGGEAVTYQGHKKAKTSNILSITDHNGYILTTTDIVAGHHNDTFNLKPHLQSAFKAIKRLGLSIAGAYFDADSAFDTLAARQVCFNHQVIPNIAQNRQNRKYAKPGRKRFFNPTIYKDRFASERTFAWIDKFRALLVRFDIKKSTSWVVISWPLRSSICGIRSYDKFQSVLYILALLNYPLGQINEADPDLMMVHWAILESNRDKGPQKAV